MTIDKIFLFGSFKESTIGIDFAGGILTTDVEGETSAVAATGMVPDNNDFAIENTAFVTFDATILAIDTANKNGLLESAVA